MVGTFNSDDKDTINRINEELQKLLLEIYLVGKDRGYEDGYIDGEEQARSTVDDWYKPIGG